MRPTRSALVLLMCLHAMRAPAATEFTASVPAELVAAFTAGSFYSDLPPDFPAFVLPDGIAPIGSLASQGRELVLLRTSRGGAESRAAVVEALMAAGGWVEIPGFGSARDYGFVVAPTGLEPVLLCHDRLGTLEVRGEDGAENRVYLRRFGLQPTMRTPTCAQQLDAQGGPPAVRAPDFGAYLPSFDSLVPQGGAGADTLGAPLAAPRLGIRGLPAGYANAPALGIRGLAGPAPATGLNGGIVSSVEAAGSVGFVSSRLEGRPVLTMVVPAEGRSLRRMRVLIAELMREQGWRRDADWSRRESLGSNWLREADGRRFLLMLQLVAAPDATYHLAYELRELGR